MKRFFVVFVLIVCSLIRLYAESNEREFFGEAESFYYAKNYVLALETYNEFVIQFQRSELIPDAQYRRALCLFHLTRFDDSLALFEKIEKRHRSTRYLDFIPFWKGMIFYYKKEYESACGNFEIYCAKQGDPNLNAQAFYYKAVCETETGKYEAAQGSIVKFLSDFPHSALCNHGFLLLAYVYFKRGNPDGVITLFNNPQVQALSSPMREKFMLYYANALMEKNRQDEAKAVYTSLLQASPDISSVALAKLFSLAQRANKIREMEDLVRIAEDTFGNNPVFLVDFWTNIGIASYLQNQLELSEYYFNRAWNYRNKISINESVPLYLSEILVKRGSAGNAVAILEDFLAGKDEKPELILFRAGSLCVKTGEYHKAIGYLGAYVKKFKSPRTAEAEYLLAYSFYHTGEIDKGIELSASFGAMALDNPLKPSAIRLQSKMLMKKGEIQKARDVLSAYLSVNKTDLQAQRDYIYILFLQKKYKEIIDSVGNLFRGNPALKKDNPALYLVLKYFEGLSYISQKDYRKALDSFSELTLENTEKQGVKEIAPSVAFYRGWSLYRLGKFRDAAQLFSGFVAQFAGHDFYFKSLYLAGWCYYSGADYPEAAKHFQMLSLQAKDGETVNKARFFMAKSLLAMNRQDEAAKMFTIIFESAPASEFADDSLFEYARIRGEQGNVQVAAASYLGLADAYPKSPLAVEALYNRAQLYYRENSFKKAIDAFYLYRERFPGGGLVDASLYWGGVCSLNLGEKFGAILLWEKLIQEHRESPFRSEALKKAAETCRQAGYYDKALTLYLELIERYPKEAEAINAQKQAQELRYLVLGLGNREAELTARIEREGGKTSRAGRLSMIELAGLYLNEQELKKIDIAHSLILQILELKEDAETAAKAQFMLGEYFYKKKDYTRAGNEFLKAAFIDAANRDLMAQAIYKSAQMMKFAGDEKTVKELVDRLIKNFPASQWAVEGKKLLEGLK